MKYSHTQAAQVFYGHAEKTPAAPRQLTESEAARQSAAAILYGGSKSTRIGTIDNALAGAYDPLESSMIDDKERLERTRQDRRTFKSLLERADAAPSDAHTLALKFLEARTLNRSEQAIADAWKVGFEQLRLNSGSTEAAMTKIAKTSALLTRLGKDNPGLAAEMEAVGVGKDPDAIEAAARIYDGIPKQPAT